MLHYLHTLLIYEANGFLVLTYVFWEHLAGILVLVSFGFFTARAPARQWVWTVGAGTLALLAAFLAPTPAPFLLAHPPLSARPDEIITAVRTREKR